jgi:hypothetical protein
METRTPFPAVASDLNLSAEHSCSPPLCVRPGTSGDRRAFTRARPGSSPVKAVLNQLCARSISLPAVRGVSYELQAKGSEDCVCHTRDARPFRRSSGHEEAERLKSELTPLGAERAGNKEGTIPDRDGGYIKVWPGYQSGQPRPDPFADEKPRLRITAKNVDQYADHASSLFNGAPHHYEITRRRPEDMFSPATLSAEGIR